VTSAPDNPLPLPSTTVPFISEVVEFAVKDEAKTKNTDNVNFLKLFIDIPSYIRNAILLR
jgi:hypothetical protein